MLPLIHPIGGQVDQVIQVERTLSGGVVGRYDYDCRHAIKVKARGNDFP